MARLSKSAPKPLLGFCGVFLLFYLRSKFTLFAFFTFHYYL